MFAGVLSALKAVIIKRERAFDWLFDRLIMWSSRKIVLFEKLFFSKEYMVYWVCNKGLFIKAIVDTQER